MFLEGVVSLKIEKIFKLSMIKVHKVNFLKEIFHFGV